MPDPKSVMETKAGRDHLGTSGGTYRIGRAMTLRTLPNSQYDKVRCDLKHHGPYLPVILEACQENQLSYEYRHGAQSYGSFTFSRAETLRADRRRNRNPTFLQLKEGVEDRLKTLKYDQRPNLVGAAKILRQQVPWTRKGKARKE